MAITVEWGTKIINVPQADLTLVSGSVYELDVDAFRLTLKDLEDDEEGMPFARTHNHNPPVTVGGVTLARVVEIINGYTVTFEDGQYAVNLVGANNNIGDVANVNQVSIRSQNSAGLIQVASGSGLSAAQADQLSELWQRHGLDQANPVVFTPTSITFGTVTLDVTGDGQTSSTVTRQ